MPWVVTMTSFIRKFIRDDGTEVEIDGTVRLWQDSLEIESYDCDPECELTPAEDERLHAELALDPGTWEIPDDYD